MKRQIKVILIMLIAFSLLLTQFASAAPGNGNAFGHNKEVTKGYEKVLKNFTVIDGERVKVNGKHVEFDVPPVIKEGRTLIPVRAITRAMGGYVFWGIAGFEVASIVNKEKSIRIDFYLDDEDEDVAGRIEIFYWEKSGYDEILDNPNPVPNDEFDKGWGSPIVGNKTDVLPGLINNRTFVPLRFISTVFGMGVTYDSFTGEIGIHNRPILKPKKVILEEIDSVDIDVVTFGYEFVEIDDLEKGDEKDDEDYYITTTKSSLKLETTTKPSLFIHLNESYIESLKDEERILEVKFEKDGKEVTREFEIILRYNDDNPWISPEKVEFDKDSNVVVDMTLNGYTLYKIKYQNDTVDTSNYAEDTKFDQVEFEGDYLEDLFGDTEDDELEFTFIFIKGDKKVKVEFIVVDEE